MNNILQAILAGLPAFEQIALLFIHSAEATHKYQVVTGLVNEVTPIAIGIASQIAAPKTVSVLTSNGTVSVPAA